MREFSSTKYDIKFIPKYGPSPEEITSVEFQDNWLVVHSLNTKMLPQSAGMVKVAQIRFVPVDGVQVVIITPK